ncbi:unnamed protein product [Rhizophagus irregularis]|uniref:Uncharacterized protein n=1 Tax=Rhizophagus irregularis TaxID=588596 RepID=A0A915Z832_9GLOM|nr:unnamed protein product [Rhizophagus irregularis]CAB5364984.1 unnamed protein product [Rhizophagus irregularis]
MVEKNTFLRYKTSTSERYCHRNLVRHISKTFHPDQSCIIQKKKIFVSNDTIGMRIKTKIIYHNALLTKSSN